VANRKQKERAFRSQYRTKKNGAAALLPSSIDNADVFVPTNFLPSGALRNCLGLDVDSFARHSTRRLIYRAFGTAYGVRGADADTPSLRLYVRFLGAPPRVARSKMTPSAPQVSTEPIPQRGRRSGESPTRARNSRVGIAARSCSGANVSGEGSGLRRFPTSHPANRTVD